jgi:hypothetical protein
MPQFFIDLHCHPQLKSYGKSFDNMPVGRNSANHRNHKHSIWYYDPPTLADKAIQGVGGIVKFRQSDFTTLAYAAVRVVCASLYPIERGFFYNELGDGALSDLANNFITSMGRRRINYLQGITNYYDDVCREYDYYKQMDGKTIRTSAGDYKYLMVRDYAAIEQYTLQHPDDYSVIFVVMTIEGLHVLHTNIDAPPVPKTLLDNLTAIKNWDCPPFFVSVAHHFYNHLCGHARSLTGIVGNTCNQQEGMNTGFTALGEQVVHRALDTATGKRIYIDIKHMSAAARTRYFELLATDYATEKIPVIVSHGAANGLRSAAEPVADGKDTAYKLLAEDINLYDNEIVMVAKSGGIFGFQLDERRIASPGTLKNTKHSAFMNKIRHYRAELLWNQVQHVAELLDRHDLFAWDCMAIGSDYDGIINPLNGYLTAETFEDLLQYLERYAYNYMSNRGKTLRAYNQLSPAEIVNRIFYDNANEFMKKWF